ncbi:MAG: CPBP family intramembrane metalloprotease [Opitutaceae bacterium]|nr:CPBP family intramembrane metalloprotease [Opitutaceae bacterium]
MSESEMSVPPRERVDGTPTTRPEPAGEPTAIPMPVAHTTDPVMDERAQIEREFRDVQRVCFFYVAMLLPVLVGTAWQFHTKSDDFVHEFYTGAALYGVIVAFALAWRREWVDLLRRPDALSRGLTGFLLATPVCTVALAHGLGEWGEAIGLPVADLLEGFGEGGYPLWLLFVWTGLLPPLFEEIAFRGLLLRKLQRLMKPVHAIWVSSLLFGLIHFSVLSMAVFLVPLAVIAGYITRRTGSLVPAIWLHAAHNFGVLILALSADRAA